jgi:hypothetical protein
MSLVLNLLFAYPQMYTLYVICTESLVCIPSDVYALCHWYWISCLHTLRCIRSMSLVLNLLFAYPKMYTLYVIGTESLVCLPSDVYALCHWYWIFCLHTLRCISAMSLVLNLLFAYPQMYTLYVIGTESFVCIPSDVYALCHWYWISCLHTLRCIRSMSLVLNLLFAYPQM